MKIDTESYTNLARFMSRRISEALLERQMSAADLCRLTGIAKATMSAILKQDNPSLPSLITLFKIGVALELRPSHFLDFLCDWRAERFSRKINSHMVCLDQIAHTDVLFKLFERLPTAEILYAPSTIPDFLKTNEVFLAEGESADDLPDYMCMLRNTDVSGIDGEIVINRDVLEILLLRTGVYTSLSEVALQEQVALLQDFSVSDIGRTRTFVLSFSSNLLTPTLNIGGAFAISYINGHYLLIDDESYVSTVNRRIRSLTRDSQQCMTLCDFLHDVGVVAERRSET